MLARRAAAYRAHYEHLPLPGYARPQGPAMLIHRNLDFGSLARLHLLDTRQHRDDQQVCVRFYDERCGYTLCTITSASWRTQFLAADTSNAGGSVQPISSWIIEAGQTTAQPA